MVERHRVWLLLDGVQHRLRWAFSNRVVAVEVTVNEAGAQHLRPGDVVVGLRRELLRVHRVDVRRLVLLVY